MGGSQHSTLSTQNTGRGAVIVAAGRGTRMGADKVWLPLGPMPVVAFSLRAFARHASRIVLVVGAERLTEARSLVQELGIDAEVCQGGERRQDSVLNGLRLLGDAVELVAIHDGARPFVTGQVIEGCYSTASRYGAAVAAVPLRDTIKRIASDGQSVETTVNREGLWAAQTPQTFRRELILGAYETLQEEVTDDAAAVEKIGYPVRIVPGDPHNMKLTTKEDLVIARAIVRAPGFRTGE